jgi:adenylate cyclase
MFTDMVGSTASAQSNELAALALRDEQAALLRSQLSIHGGREIKSMGDGFLVEFDSALRAMQCAIEIQQRLYERNAQRGMTPILLRIGVHLGDVEQRDGDIFGDAVNLASRLESQAAPGGVCISGEVYSQVRARIPNQFEKLPPTPLKGVNAPIDLYRVVLPWTVRLPPSTVRESPGLAVLPFSNISPDPKDEYFADGLTEELITVLAQLPGLRVIARTSVAQFKSSTKPVSQIGAELGVTSVLEGSVRKAGNRLRITAQLIDAATEGHLWANTYERELDDVFAVQADLAKEVAEALRLKLRPAPEGRSEARAPVRSDSYLAYLKGRTLLHKTEPQAMEEATRQFELAISLDPTNASAHSGRADAIRMAGWFAPTDSRAKWRDASRSAQRAIELEPGLAEGHASLGIILWDDYDYAGAEKELKLATSLNPSYSLARLWYACVLEDQGRPGEALPQYQMGEAADPLWELNLQLMARSLRWNRHLDEAFATAHRLARLVPASAYAHLELAECHYVRSELAPCLAEIRIAEEVEQKPLRKQHWRARYYSYTGEKEKSRELLRGLEASFDGTVAPWSVAQSYARIGDLDDCFRMLDRLVETHQLPMQELRNEPALENVRGDPRFPDLLRRQNLG